MKCLIESAGVVLALLRTATMQGDREAQLIYIGRIGELLNQMIEEVCADPKGGS